MDKGHYNALGERGEVVEEKYFNGLARMDMIVVQPADWRRGHGGRLAQWGIDLAKLDKVSQGVLAARMGKSLYLSLGYENLEDLHIDGDDVVPRGVEVSAMQYCVKLDSGAERLRPWPGGFRYRQER